MAVDMFLKVDGVTGESMDDAHGEEIDVLAWSWGMSNSGTAHSGGGAGAGKVNVQDVTVTKYIDKSSTDLMLFCCNGKHIPECKLTVRKAGEEALEYLVITMNECMITSIGTGGSGGEDRLTEHIAINFGEVNVEYKPQTKEGSGGPACTMGWKIAANVKK
jgi:type VI secretion system secreted protein Hcp